jgi:hypothetical protein
MLPDLVPLVLLDQGLQDGVPGRARGSDQSGGGGERSEEGAAVLAAAGV